MKIFNQNREAFEINLGWRDRPRCNRYPSNFCSTTSIYRLVTPTYVHEVCPSTRLFDLHRMLKIASGLYLTVRKEQILVMKIKKVAREESSNFIVNSISEPISYYNFVKD